MTSEKSNDESVVTIGGHAIARRLLYAGGSRWPSSEIAAVAMSASVEHDWDVTESGWAWVIDGKYRLDTPNLFDLAMIELRTGYYLLDGYDEWTSPKHDGRDPIYRVPDHILLDIHRGLVAAVKAAKDAELKESAEASKAWLEGRAE